MAADSHYYSLSWSPFGGLTRPFGVDSAAYGRMLLWGWKDYGDDHFETLAAVLADVVEVLGDEVDERLAGLGEAAEDDKLVVVPTLEESKVEFVLPYLPNIA